MKIHSSGIRWLTVWRADQPAQPWKNGGGLTQELLSLPPGNTWCLRVSVARIDRSGEFSNFPETERWFSLLEGGNLQLQIGQQLHPLQSPSEPVHFSGAEPTTVILEGNETLDLNFMVRGAKFSQMSRVIEPKQIDMSLGMFVAIYNHTTGVLRWAICDSADARCVVDPGNEANLIYLMRASGLELSSTIQTIS